MFDKGNAKLVHNVRGYMSSVGIVDLQELSAYTDNQIDQKVKDLDQMMWQQEMDNRTTLELYRSFKRTIGQEDLYDNSYDSQLLFRARTNSLDLNWRKRFHGQTGECRLCEAEEEETLDHFLTRCAGLLEVRLEYGVEGMALSVLLMFEEGCRIETARQ